MGGEGASPGGTAAGGAPGGGVGGESLQHPPTTFLDGILGERGGREIGGGWEGERQSKRERYTFFYFRYHTGISCEQSVRMM